MVKAYSLFVVPVDVVISDDTPVFIIPYNNATNPPERIDLLHGDSQHGTDTKVAIRYDSDVDYVCS